MTTKLSLTFSRSLRNKVAKASDGGPSVGTWLKRIEALDSAALNEAVAGIWCGYNGKVTLDLPGSNSMLVMGWYHGRVEFSYLS